MSADMSVPKVLFSDIARLQTEGCLHGETQEIQRLQQLAPIDDAAAEDLLHCILNCFLQRQRQEEAVQFSREYFKTLASWKVTLRIQKSEAAIVTDVLSELLSAASKENNIKLASRIIDELETSYASQVTIHFLKKVATCLMNSRWPMQ